MGNGLRDEKGYSYSGRKIVDAAMIKIRAGLA